MLAVYFMSPAAKMYAPPPPRKLILACFLYLAELCCSPCPCTACTREVREASHRTKAEEQSRSPSVVLDSSNVKTIRCPQHSFAPIYNERERCYLLRRSSAGYTLQYVHVARRCRAYNSSSCSRSWCVRRHIVTIAARFRVSRNDTFQNVLKADINRETGDG